MRVFPSAHVFAVLAASVFAQAASAQTPATASSIGQQAVSSNDVTRIQYGDPQFQQKIAAGKAPKLEIEGVPSGILLSPYLDSTGFYIWYPNDPGKKVKCYLPDSVRIVQDAGGRHLADDMRVQAVEAVLTSNNNAKGFAALADKATITEFVLQMQKIGSPTLDLTAKLVQKAAANSPDNPYLQICNATLCGMQAFKPILDDMQAGKPVIDLNNPQVIKQLGNAVQLIEKAVKTAKLAEETEGLARELARRTGKKFEPIDVIGNYSPYDNLGSLTRQADHVQLCLIGLRDGLPQCSPLKRKPSESAPPKKSP